MQNHLLQVFEWLAMEPPERLEAECIAKEKLALLSATSTLDMKDCFLGQYTAAAGEPGYLDDQTVPAGSRCPTFAALVLRVDNDRWRGVPFLLRAGKGLDERLAEVRVTFKKKGYNTLLPGEPNELVLRIQPDEGIYVKCINKRPGWNHDQMAPVQLKMSYRHSFPGSYVAGAYERMLLNASKGDQSLFVGSTELVEAWRIFTPLLDEIDRSRPQPVPYPFGSAAPDGVVEFARRHDVVLDALSSDMTPAAEEASREASPESLVLEAQGLQTTPVKGGAMPGLACSGMKTRRAKRPAAADGDASSKPPSKPQSAALAAPSVEPPTPPRKWRKLKSNSTF
mmetsp:Transcript_46756/g.134668  ORF Transcript_46756/g.134668 Transcript_46756/m.134668 type:complete len:339 (-) Transcript_46756:40-1056(-)